MSAASNEAMEPPKNQIQPMGQPKNDGEMPPLDIFEEELKKICKEEGGDKFRLMHIADPLVEVGLSPDQDIADMSESERDKARSKLTMAQVKEHSRFILVPNSYFELLQELTHKVRYADERNDPKDPFVMHTTYSTYCMYPVMESILTKAIKGINKTLKGENENNDPGFARAIAAIMAVHTVDNWRHDFEEPEENEKVIRRVAKLVRLVLSLSDSEIGFLDDGGVSRQGLVYLMSFIADAWLGGRSKVLVAKNGMGYGRPAEEEAPTKQPRPKRQKLLSQVVSTPLSGGGLESYLNTMSPELLELRAKTTLQLEVTNLSSPDKSSIILISGATHCKKLNQFIAYLTGYLTDFTHHRQKGSCPQGSRIELDFAGKKTWLATKRSKPSDATVIVDQTIKVIQLFQGLTLGQDTGIVFDSQQAKEFARKHDAAVWVAPGGTERYGITIQAIVPNRAYSRSQMPLPRVVSHEDEPEYDKIHIGKEENYIKVINSILREGRSASRTSYCVSASTTHEEFCDMLDRMAARPITTDALALDFKEENLAAAGPPVNGITLDDEGYI